MAAMRAETSLGTPAAFQSDVPTDAATADVRSPGSDRVLDAKSWEVGSHSQVSELISQLNLMTGKPHGDRESGAFSQAGRLLSRRQQEASMM